MGHVMARQGLMHDRDARYRARNHSTIDPYNAFVKQKLHHGIALSMTCRKTNDSEKLRPMSACVGCAG